MVAMARSTNRMMSSHSNRNKIMPRLMKTYERITGQCGWCRSDVTALPRKAISALPPQPHCHFPFFCIQCQQKKRNRDSDSTSRPFSALWNKNKTRMCPERGSLLGQRGTEAYTRPHKCPSSSLLFFNTIIVFFLSPSLSSIT